MSLVSRDADPIIIAVIVSGIIAGVFFAFAIPAIEEKGATLKKENELVMNSNCDELKQIILEHIEGKNVFYQRNIDKAKLLYEWKCEK